MPFIHEIQITSTGFPGAPGFTNLYFATTIGGDRTAQFVAAYNFMTSMSHQFPSQWSGQINAEGRVLESTTGILAEFSSTPAPNRGVVQGDLGTTYGAGMAGMVVGWGTATVTRGRVVRGRTFLVPASAGLYASDGTIFPGQVQQMQTAANRLITDAVGFGIWSRPRLGLGGILAPVVNARASSKAAFLSSRRD